MSELIFAVGMGVAVFFGLFGVVITSGLALDIMRNGFQGGNHHPHIPLKKKPALGAWQPIETAPVGEVIIRGRWYYTLAFGWQWACDIKRYDGNTDGMTLWKPIQPPPPE